MINSLKSLLGMGPKVDFSQLKRNGAQIIDVRTPGEFKTGHIQGSINIP
jgi:rhodanese-related sulfurtransferase